MLPDAGVRWVGLLEVVSKPFFDEKPIWSSQVCPSRVEVRVVLALPPEHGVPVLEMREELTVFRGLDNPNRSTPSHAQRSSLPILSMAISN